MNIFKQIVDTQEQLLFDSQQVLDLSLSYGK